MSKKTKSEARIKPIFFFFCLSFVALFELSVVFGERSHQQDDHPRASQPYCRDDS